MLEMQKAKNVPKMTDHTKYLTLKMIEKLEETSLFKDGFIRDCLNGYGNTGYPDGQLRDLQGQCKTLLRMIQEIFDSMESDLKIGNSNHELETLRQGLIAISGIEWSEKNKGVLAQSVDRIWESMRSSKETLKYRLPKL